MKPRFSKTPEGRWKCSTFDHSATAPTIQLAFSGWVRTHTGYRLFRYRCSLDHEFSALAKSERESVQCPGCPFDNRAVQNLGEGEARQLGGPVFDLPQPPMILQGGQ